MYGQKVIIAMMLSVSVHNDEVLSDEGGDTVVPWWSFTKTVIAAAVLVQVQSGLLSLDETLGDWPFTLRQLLRHQAGLPDYGELLEYQAAVERRDPPWNDDEMLAKVKASQLRYCLGESWGYSNIGYLYARRILERSTGENFESALRRLVFHPLGLENVRLAILQRDLDGVAMDAPATYDPRWVYHGLIVGPLAEAAFLLDRLMAGHLISQPMLTAMLDACPVSGPIVGRQWHTPKYGLGLMVGETDDGISVAGHTGGGPGSCIAVYRDTVSSMPFSCAAFAFGQDGGAVERKAMSRHRVR